MRRAACTPDACDLGLAIGEEYGTPLQCSRLENPMGWRSLVGCSPWGREESEMTERLHFHVSLSCFGEGNGNPLQCSCLENPRDRGAWWAAVYGVTQSRTRLKRLSSSSSSSSSMPPVIQSTSSSCHPSPGGQLSSYLKYCDSRFIGLPPATALLSNGFFSLQLGGLPETN